MLHLLRGLKQRGIRSTLLAHPTGILINRAREAGLEVLPLPAIGLMAAPWPLLLPLRNKVRGLGVNLLHIHDSRGLWVGLWLKRWTKLPAVLSRRIASPLRRNRISINKYSPANLQAVIAVSETVREVFSRFGYPEDRIHVVTDGLDIEELSAYEHDERFRSRFGGSKLIGGIGKLSVKKNWQLLVRAAARLAGQGHDFRWVVFGDGPERENLETLAKDLGVDAIVDFIGFNDEATRLLRSFDLLFHPSLMEGASVTIRSAMVMGVPVVSADAPASVESLGGCGWVVGGDDVDGTAACIFEALYDEEKKNELVGRARSSAIERFSISNTVEGTVRVYKSVLNGSRRPALRRNVQ